MKETGRLVKEITLAQMVAGFTVPMLAIIAKNIMLSNVMSVPSSKILVGDCLEQMAKIKSESIDCVVTSPPYNKKGLGGKQAVTNQIWQRFNIDYSQYGDNMPEKDYQLFMIAVLEELHRVIKPAGSIFFNHKPRRFQNRCYLPTDFMSSSKANLYQLIIWNRHNSPNIRNDILVPCTEHIYWFVKDKPKTFRKAIGSQYQSEVWNISPSRDKTHPASFPEQLVENCIGLTTNEGDTVFDPFLGSGTVAVVAERNRRNWIGIEIDPEYVAIAKTRIESAQPEMELF